MTTPKKPATSPLAHPDTVVHTKLGNDMGLVSTVSTNDGKVVEINPEGLQRTKLTFTYRKDSPQSLRLEQFEKTGATYQLKGTVWLNSKRSIAELKRLLESLEEIDLSSLLSGKLAFASGLQIDDKELGDKLLAIYKANPAAASKLFVTVLQQIKILTGEDLDTLAKRKKGLSIFKKMLESPDENQDLWIKLREHYKVNQQEKVIEKFLRFNDWILGYGLDYSFNVVNDELKTFQDDEGNLKNLDIPLSANETLNIVELKLPSEPIFLKSEDSHGHPKLNPEFSEYIMQIQTYLRLAEEKRNTTQVQKIGTAYNPKGYLIIGNSKDMTPKQKKFFESYRSYTLNPTILTYDELLQRATHIVEATDKEKSS